MLDFSPRILYTPKKGKSTKKKQLFIIKHCNVGNITTGKHLCTCRHVSSIDTYCLFSCNAITTIHY